jgi:hypothetical protein
MDLLAFSIGALPAMDLYQSQFLLCKLLTALLQKQYYNRFDRKISYLSGILKDETLK